MKMKRLIPVVLTLLALFIMAAGSVSAQSVDIENMSNEQLMQLLLQIMNRLESEGSEETPEPSAPMVPTPTPTIVPTAFSIYELKKLIIEALPGYMFVQPEEHSEPDPQKTDPLKTPTGGIKTPEPVMHDCTPCFWYCPPNGDLCYCRCE